MISKLHGRVSLVLFIFISCYAQDFEIPKVHILALKPKGCRVWIEDEHNIGVTILSIHGIIYRKNLFKQYYIQSGFGAVFDNSGCDRACLEPTKDSPKIFDYDYLDIIVGDAIGYRVQMLVGNLSKEYSASGVFYVNELVDPPSSSSSTQKTTETKKNNNNEENAHCSPTATIVRGGGTACAGQTIFEDNFDTFREDYWQIEQYIPVQHPEYPFVTYQRLADDPTVSVSNGHLKISPKLQQNVRGFNNETIYSGSLNLFSGCTAAAESCMYQASGADIIPPVVSGRITSKSFAFTYGTVHVRAKLPKGDWLYPEILLEPVMKKYGSNGYASGVLRIAGARGNRHLVSGSNDYSNKVLYGGPIMDYQCHDTLIKSKKQRGSVRWGDDYHIYSVRWAPDGITLSVDGSEWYRVESTASGLAGKFPDTCRQLPKTLLDMGSRMAPFDDHFTISLGLGAGSVTEFPDGTTSGNIPKPWRNRGRKAILNFWQDMPAWISTWRNPRLLIDYVKVVAL